MPEIIIANLKSKSIDCTGKRENLLNILLSETDWMHACGAKGRCTTCRAKIISGMENLSERTAPEIQYMKLNKLQPDERLTCQVEVNGDIKIEVPTQTQLPHLTYER